MELVEGETLADRLARGPITLDEVSSVAGQIADALEAAHQKGIVHRDLKPANVMITPSGAVKILDFGVAKILSNPAPDDATLTEMTAPHVVLGTPAYAAPEQAQGGTVDTRVDVWAFGVLVYEMITGERPFHGDSRQALLAAVLTTDPDWDRVPPAWQPLLRACLQRDARKRLRDIADYRFLLLPPPDPSPGPVRRSRGHSLLIATAALAALALTFLAGMWLNRNAGTATATVPIRLTTMLPSGVSVTRGPGYTSSVAVSPDGRTVVIAAGDKDGQRLYRRTLDRIDATPIAGTDRATSPFYSWDGEWIGFFADGRLKRIPAAGGAAIDIVEAPGFSSGASWGPDGRIVFAYGADSDLLVVPAMGGTTEPLGNQARGRQPEVLPNGHAVLFEAAGHVHVHDRQSGRTTKLFPGTAPRFANGHVLFSRGTTLLAAPINVENFSTGTTIPVAQGVAVELPGSGGGRHYAVARNGTLVYVPAAEAYELVVVGANAVERVIGLPQRSLENPRFSPDGQSLVVASRRHDDERTDLWLHDLVGGATRLTSDGGRAPVWSDDGQTITYSHVGDRQGIYRIRVDGRSDPAPVRSLQTFHWLVGWSPDRSTLVYGVMTGGQSSIVAYSNAQPRTIVGPGNTWGGRLSRDGKWLAYYLLSAGTFEVYVTPFPQANPRWLIAEGTDPAWGPNSDEIYYRSGARLVAARLEKTAGVKVSTRRIVVDSFLPPLYDDYDIHHDGHTLALVRPVNRTQGREVTIVLDWFSDFRGAGR